MLFGSLAILFFLLANGDMAGPNTVQVGQGELAAALPWAAAAASERAGLPAAVP